MNFLITKDMRLVDIISENQQAPQILMTLRIGCGESNTNENITLEESCIEHGINIEHAIRQLSFRRCY